jgi:magnesium-transporting ATPase (P-type)
METRYIGSKPHSNPIGLNLIFNTLAKKRCNSTILPNRERRNFGRDFLEKAVSMRLKEVFDALDASPDGLTSEEAETLLKKYGLNTLIEKKNRRFSYKFL